MSRRDPIKQATAIALAALQNKHCRDLFSKDVDPVKLLQELASSGKIKYDFSANPRNANPGHNAETVMTGAHAGDIRFSPNPETKFNSGDPSWGTWGLSVAMNRAITLIHELGHAANAIKGPGSSRIRNDGYADTQASENNSERVYNACFRKFGPYPEFTY